MLLVIEIITLMAGLSALTSGTLPSWLLRRAKQKPRRAAVRWLGLILMLPFSVGLLGSIALNARLGDQGTAYAMVLEIVVLVAAVSAATLVFQQIRRQMKGQKRTR